MSSERKSKFSVRLWQIAGLGVALYACGAVKPIASNTGFTHSQAGLEEFNLGLKLESNNDYSAARDAYLRALAAASSNDTDPTFIADITYNLGRMAGYTCDFRMAEAMLRESLKLVESRSISLTPNRSRRLFELGRLAMDEGRFADAVSYFERALPVLENVRMVTEDPLGFAYILDELAYALEGAGQVDRAIKLRARSIELRQKNDNKPMRFRPKHFAEGCAETSTNKKDWNVAHRNWSVMAAFASKVETSSVASSRILLEYGRSLGVLCEFQEAERILRQAQQLFVSDKGSTHLVLIELARLNLAQKKYLSALSYLDEIFKHVANGTQSDIEPGWHEEIVDEYAAALTAVGRDEQAIEKRKHMQVRDPNITYEPGYRTPYGSQCVNTDSGIMG